MLSTKSSYKLYIYIKQGLALNNLQWWLICHKTQQDHIYIYIYIKSHMKKITYPDICGQLLS